MESPVAQAEIARCSCRGIRQLKSSDRFVVEAAPVPFGPLLEARHQGIGHIAQGERGHQPEPQEPQKSI